MDGLFPYLAESGILGEVRDVTVHFSVHLNVFDYLGPVGLEAAVHVVELDARDLACRPVVQLGRKVLGEGVVLAVLLPAAHEVIAFFPDHPHHLRNFFRGVLQIGIQGDHNLPLSGGKAFIERGRFAVVPAEADAPYLMAGISPHLPDHLPGAVGRAVIHKDELIGIILEGAVYPGFQFRERFRLVIQGNYK